MNTPENIDLVAERERDADIDALSDATLTPFQVIEPEADIYDLAVILAGLRKGFDLPHLIDFGRGSFGKCTIMVKADWFNAEFAGNPNVVVEPLPQHGSVKKTIDYEGVEIYCWIKAKFELVAA